MKNVLVTGAAGFAGCNLVERLLEENYRVYAPLRPGSPHNDRLKKRDGLVTFVCDMKDFDTIPEYIGDEGIDTFYHLAWRGGRDDFAEQYENIDVAVKAVKTAVKLGCSRFICTGSQAEYGITREIQTEDSPTKPDTAYGVAKLSAMYLTKHLAHQLGIEWIWARIFSLYGKYEPKTTFYQSILAALKNNEPFTINNESANWDYLDAYEAAGALIALGEKGFDGEIYNVASGECRTLGEFAEYMKKNIDSDSVLTFGNGEEYTGMSLQPSIEKLSADTMWRPEGKFGIVIS